MDLKDFLDGEPMLNRAELARRLWPHIKNPKIKLHMKLSETATGSSGSKQRITEKDQREAKRIIGELGEKLLKWSKE